MEALGAPLPKRVHEVESSGAGVAGATAVSKPSRAWAERKSGVNPASNSVWKRGRMQVNKKVMMTTLLVMCFTAEVERR